MEWTIEKVRELPADNWLGIKRVGEHAWQINNSYCFMLHTGDGGILEYVKAFDQALIEEMKNYGVAKA